MVTANPPPLESLDDVISRDDLAAFFGVKPGSLNKWIYEDPPLPYIPFKNRRFFSKRQVAWWMNQMQERPDQTHLLVRGALKARRERGTTA